MLVSYRVMGNVRALYQCHWKIPAPIQMKWVLQQVKIPAPIAFLPVTAVPPRYTVNENRLVKPNRVTQLDRFEELSTVEEYTRLHAALMSRFD
jgi:hypothetical protein